MIVGGINALKNESKDCLIYDAKNNSFERIKEAVPYKSSYVHNSFTKLTSGYYCIFTADAQIIQYDPMVGIFFGIRKRD